MTIPNTELFQKIDAQITGEPRSFWMGDWEASTDYLDTYWSEAAGGRVEYTPEDVAECGTTRCVAGWAIHFSRRPGDTRSLRLVAWDIARSSGPGGDGMTEAAAHLLGLDHDDAHTLFIHADEREAGEIVHHFAQGENDVALRKIATVRAADVGRDLEF